MAVVVRFRTLDISETQILAHFPDDEGGYYWHHRILLVRAGNASTWVSLTPDMEYHVIRLDTHEHIVLGRASPFPDAQLPFSYIFDPISRAELSELKRRARTQAYILAGEGDDDAVAVAQWLIAGPDAQDIGSEVPQEVLEDPMRFRELGNRAVAEIDGAVVFCEQVPNDEKEKWASARRAAESDDRTIGLHLRNGRRYISLHEALPLFTQQAYPDWNLVGPRVAREYLESVDEAGGFVAYEREWARLSGVHSGSAARHEHNTGNETLRLAIEVDQLDGSNLQCVENLCRRQVQLELAVERSPVHPNFTGLSEIMGGPTDDTGAANTRKFRAWVGERQKERANVLKQA
ncbi:MAG: hypothetical protein NXI07_14965, partial [bacterium]|nr:hypothetical protein [bacterium]